MNIKIVCVGKIKEAFYRDAMKEYIKRISSFANVTIMEVADEKTSENASPKEVELVKEKEGERILKQIKEKEYVIGLAIDGKMKDSLDFAKTMQEYQIHGISSIVFVIGGSLGLSDSILSRCDETLSFSKMTFPHQLMRVILLEQIYRGFRIIHNMPYHK